MTTACGDRSDPVLHLQTNGSLRITPPSLAIDDGDTVDVAVVLRDGAGNRVNELPGGTAIQWSSFGSSVVAVDGNGMTARLRGLKPGRTVVRAALGTLSASSEVDVKPVPTALVPQGPAVRVGLAGELAPNPARVQVLDRHGSPVPGVPVLFTVVRGGGTAVKTQVPSDDFGMAATPWVLGPSLGLQEMEASVQGVEPTRLLSYVNGDLASATLTAVSPGGNTGIVGTALPDMLEVRARDVQGRPVLGVGVEWIASSGTLLPTSPVTDLDGRARARWILGREPGIQTASVRLTLPQRDGSGTGVSPEVVVTFEAQVSPSTPARLSVLPRSMVLELGGASRANVALLDALGNVVPGPYSTDWTFTEPGILSREPHASGDAILSGSKPGTTRVIVRSAELSDTIDVLVQGASGGDPGPIVELLSDPDTLALHPGQSAGLTARAFDAAGRPLPTGDATWSSDDLAVARVDAFGRVTAEAEGSTTVRVVLGGLEASTRVIVSPPGGSVPSRITDLRVTGATANSLDVSFTVGGDGTGAPAIHEIRYAPSPMAWGWGQATILSSGPCASPIVPNRVGEIMTCRIGNLVAGHRYDVQMVTWRDEGGERFFSPLSSVATGSTVAVDGGVDRLVVSPSTATVAPGSTVSLRATAYDASGNALPNAPLTWTSSNQGVATVNGAGLVTGVASGTATIRVEADGAVGTASVSVSAKPGEGTIASISVSPASATLRVGNTVRLVGTARDPYGTVVPNVGFSYSSNATGVASVDGGGLVQARSTGTATITVQAGGYFAEVRVDVVSPPPPPEGVWFQVDFDDYSSTEEMLAAPDFHAYGLDPELITLSQPGPWGGSKAFRHNFLNNHSGILELNPIAATTAQPDEFWLEFWVKFGPTWTTRGQDTNGYLPEHKFLLVYDDQISVRFEHMSHQNYGSPGANDYLSTSGGSNGNIDRSPITPQNDEYDGRWYLFRYHAKLSETDGLFRMKNYRDGTTLNREIGFSGRDTNLASNPAIYFRRWQIGANTNQGTPKDTHIWYDVGAPRVYLSDPGWGW